MTALRTADYYRSAADSVKSAWGDAAGAWPSADDRFLYLEAHQCWPSDYVLGFLVRCLSVPQILEALEETTLRGFVGGPRDLGAWYHRCYDRIVDSEIGS